VYDFHVKFSEDLTSQKSLKSVNFDIIIKKIKGGGFLGHSVVAFVQMEYILVTQCVILSGNERILHQRAGKLRRTARKVDVERSNQNLTVQSTQICVAIFLVPQNEHLAYANDATVCSKRHYVGLSIYTPAIRLTLEPFT